MSTFKKHEVVMLATNKKADYHISMKTVDNGGAKLGSLDFIKDPARISTDNTFWTGQHLYILSDEKIEKGDKIVHKDVVLTVSVNRGLYTTVEEFSNVDVRTDLCKKIIATTDSSVLVNDDGSGMGIKFPKPSLSFIEKFVTEYNKGNVIKEVMVEYVVAYNSDQSLAILIFEGEDYVKLLKINPKDNTITIRKAQDTLKEFIQKNPELKKELSDLLSLAWHNGYWSKYEEINGEGSSNENPSPPLIFIEKNI